MVGVSLRDSAAVHALRRCGPCGYPPACPPFRLLKFELSLPGASRVVCPLSVLATWTAELARWCPRLRVVKLHSSDEAERERLKDVLRDEVGSYDVVITT